MVHDRGKIKWASLMLPEHVEMLQDFFSEEPPKEKPVLSEDYVNEMESTVQQVIHTKQKVRLDYYQYGSFNPIIGHIIKMHPNERKITVQEASMISKVPFDNIVAIELLNE
ncbi:YolD-like protein [Gracilibacillus orientalis]|uniref:YolD-like protein n=1 Tax=Gracilibacillus orientalis TaxID=334253 RepID=A0A1I4L5P5_9BACI|nr:YolD-like family protein [Gracilibacillus orientalis]SFL86186.1 YolD-like protein [Gracilibacillus orientalis]